MSHVLAQDAGTGERGGERGGGDGSGGEGGGGEGEGGGGEGGFITTFGSIAASRPMTVTPNLLESRLNGNTSRVSLTSAAFSREGSPSMIEVTLTEPAVRAVSITESAGTAKRSATICPIFCR